MARVARVGEPSRPFSYRQGQLCAAGVPMAALARRFGTPLYVYDGDAIAAAYSAFDQALAHRSHLICAAVKANANLALLRRLAALGSGFDVVSGGELERVLQAGGPAGRIVFSGVGKSAEEMDAALRAGILLFQVESEPELDLLRERAERLRRPARYGLRINPGVSAATHRHIATGLPQHKFGVDAATARRLYRRHRAGRLQPCGISFHVGSQLLQARPLIEAARRVAALARELLAAGIPLRYFDAGGGLGIAYRRGQRPPSLAAYLEGLETALAGTDLTLLLEPGRRLFAAAGLLLTEVLYDKRSAGTRFLITDAASNDLMRPALYGAYHEIVPVRLRAGARRRVDIAGPVCETGDTFAHARTLPPVRAGDLLAILDAGAYGFTLASNYNARRRAAEVVIENGRARLVRRRETMADLLQPELDCQTRATLATIS